MTNGNAKSLCMKLMALILLFVLTNRAGAQDAAQVPERHLLFPALHSNALRGNLIGDSSRRTLLVLLPPSYYQSRITRFPVVYYLHGLGKRSNGHRESIGMFTQYYLHMRQRKLSEMILVAVDGTTSFGGSYYTNSPAIGNFETYVAREIVAMVDSAFRTKQGRQWRAVAGFSMGGHGAIKLGMKYSDVFGQVGSLSGSPLSIRYRKSVYRNALARHTRPSSVQDLKVKITFEQNWSLAAAYAKASAFSPNPNKPPLYLDLPFQTGNDERDLVWQKWLDEDPLSLVSRYKDELATLDQIYIDHGEDETTLGTEDFLRELVRYGIGHTHFIFRGDHTDELFLRHLRMLRFLAARWAGE
jgi:S-formylglutathione hydrolase FrmB